MKKAKKQEPVYGGLLLDEDGIPPPEGDEIIAHGEHTTPRGHRVDEANSALQKAVRRSEEENALYWARESYEARPHNLWKRLFTYSSEDVGIADSNVCVQIRTLYENWKQFHDQMWVVHAVLILVRAPKSRIVDHAGIAAFGAKSPSGKQASDPVLAYREVPDHTLDKHTARGRAMGRGYKHFFNEGTVL